MSEWVAKHLGHIVAATAVLTVFLAALTVWLVTREHNVESRIPVVQRIGSPCRSAFASGGLKAVQHDRQCTEQTNLIFANFCFHHPVLCNGSKGVDTGSGNKAPSGLPGPPSGGRPQHQPQVPPETPPAAPSQPHSPVPLGPLEKPVCDTTGALNVPVCN